MQIVFHIGAHSTDDELLLRTLQQNADALAQRGVLVPEPAKYRPVLRDTLLALRGKLASADVQDVVLDTILEDADGDRVVFSSENFICTPQRVFDGGAFYSKMGQKAGWLRNLFPDFEVIFALGMRDPATLVPALFERRGLDDFPAFRAEITEESLSWSRVVAEFRAAVPDAPLIAWCNEDTPLVWPEVLRAVAGVDATVPLEGTDGLLETIMSETGLARMREYLAQHPPKSVLQRRRIVTAFLDKFALDEVVEEEVDLEGWTEPVMDALTARYESDMERIAEFPKVTLLVP